MEPGPDGTTRLRARVTAAPEKGRANAALIALLAKTWGVPKSALDVASGQSDRSKVIAVAPTAQGAVAAWLAEASRARPEDADAAPEA